MRKVECTGQNRWRMFLSNYRKAYKERVQQQRGLFSYSRTGLHYSEGEIQSSIRAHAAEIHVDAADRAAALTEGQLRRGSNAVDAVGEADIDAIEREYASRDSAVHDARAWSRIIGYSQHFRG